MVSGSRFLCCVHAGVEENNHLQNIALPLPEHSSFIQVPCYVKFYGSLHMSAHFFGCLIIWVAFLNCIFIPILLYRLLLLPHLFHKLLPYRMLLGFFWLFTPPFYLIFKMKISLLFSEYESNTCSSFSNSNHWKD